jgi:hypothetical protein
MVAPTGDHLELAWTDLRGRPTTLSASWRGARPAPPGNRVGADTSMNRNESMELRWWGLG